MFSELVLQQAPAYMHLRRHANVDGMQHSRPTSMHHMHKSYQIGPSSHSGGALRIEDVTETAREHGPKIRGTVVIDDEDDERSTPNSPITQAVGHGTIGTSTNYRPKEMIRAAIEASKKGVTVPNQLFDDHLGAGDPSSQQGGQSQQEDAELARVVSLSLQTAEREKALRELEGKSGDSEVGLIPASEESVSILSSGRRSYLEHGGPSFQDKAEDAKDLTLGRHRRSVCSIFGQVVTELPDSGRSQRKAIRSFVHYLVVKVT
ncbi:UBX domain-containing family protein [Striga asiatica]|uniref:UBX domain-containing family protein n=1 Tax=Striga asiatica TaxID=4170 RepID=A0A5A7RC59_STRAF|nr:UBX domain-containing family protein [Striga asiatica]